MLNYYGISRDDIFSSENSKIDRQDQRYNKKNKLSKNPSRNSKFTTLSSSSSQKNIYMMIIIRNLIVKINIISIKVKE